MLSLRCDELTSSAPLEPKVPPEHHREHRKDRPAVNALVSLERGLELVRLVLANGVEIRAADREEAVEERSAGGRLLVRPAAVSPAATW